MTQGRALSERLDGIASWWTRHDAVLYAAFALCCTIYAASAFYGYMLIQTRGSWSAPLDDVFIHFDYARSFARGYPFEWSEGNGYSSGNTSLTYPIVLAFGYWLGFRGTHGPSLPNVPADPGPPLMMWAAIVAVVSVFTFLFCTGRMIDRFIPDRPTQRWFKYLVPPAVLSLGALDWTLFSGMENAFHLAMWGLCAVAAARFTRAEAPRAMRAAMLLGFTGALLVAARPESGVCVLSFGVACAIIGHRRAVTPGWRKTLTVLFAIGAPAMLLLLVHGFANLTFTGEWSANGSITKLFINNPYMSSGDKWERYKSLLGYIIPRLTHHHFADTIPFGWLVVAMALVPFASKRTRPIAFLLWSQLIGWLLLVGLNNQLRWHNERYSMPSVAWLLVLAALGVGVLAEATRRFQSGQRRVHPLALVGPLAAATVVVSYWTFQADRMRDQIWFFGRASRNILDQHVTAGLVIKKLNARRVLVGDAGAMTYTADRPGLDLIGLGGFRDYPFARSNVNGLGASLELIERMPETERPDLMAIYPSWWGDLPTYFGQHVISIPVEGNVICGGAETVIYRANWQPMDRLGRPRTLKPGEQIIDELDVADLLSEVAHDYNLPQPSVGFISYRVMGDPTAGKQPLFDAGRIVPPGVVERSTLRRPPSDGRGDGRLIVRVAPKSEVSVLVRIDGQRAPTLQAEPRAGRWQELSLPLATGDGHFTLELEPRGDESVHYHIWVVSDPASQPAAPAAAGTNLP